MMGPSPRVVRTTLLFFSVQLAALWVTKPFTTGFERWTPTPLAHAVTVVIALVWGAVFWWLDTRGRPDPPLDDDPVRDAATLEPADENNGFCTCPSCGLLGTHYVEQDVFRTPKYDDGRGGVVEVVCDAMPRDGAAITYRTCMFCDHVWMRPRV